MGLRDGAAPIEGVRRRRELFEQVHRHYLFMINEGERHPAVNQPSIDRMRELNAQWASLKTRATEILERDILQKQAEVGCGIRSDLEVLANQRARRV